LRPAGFGDAVFGLEVVMKRVAVSFIFLGFLFCASLCSAAYVILLKDGRTITTREYREEGDQIKIEQYGGMVGFSKDDVVSIEETDNVKALVVKSPPEKKPEVAKEKAGPGQMESEESKKEKAPEEPDMEKASQEKNPLLREFDALKNRFGNVKSMSKEELVQFQKDLAKLRTKMLEADIGGSYADHLSDIMFMGGKVEKMLKKKGQ
jgi:hypothetical protein